MAIIVLSSGNSTDVPRTHKVLLLADWSLGGHNSLYLRMIILAVENVFSRFVIFSPLHEVVASELSRSDPTLADRCEFHDFRKKRSTILWVPGRFQGHAAAFQAGRKFSGEVRRLRSTNNKVTVFFPCFQDWEFFYIRWFLRGFRRPAKALLIAADFLRRENPKSQAFGKCLRRSRLNGIATLDEFRVKTLSAKVGTGKNTAWIPDVADYSAREEGTLTREMMERSANRPIIMAVGKLAPKKGLSRLLDLVEADVQQRFFFAIVGRWIPEIFSPEERARFGSIAKLPNVFFPGVSIPTEAEYNQLVAFAKLLYLAYPDFCGSSNNLTKAGFLGVPVLVEKGFLLEDRVLKYRLGMVVSASAESKTVLSEIDQFIRSWKGPGHDFRDWFRRDFSFENFSLRLRSFLLDEETPVQGKTSAAKECCRLQKLGRSGA